MWSGLKVSKEPQPNYKWQSSKIYPPSYDNETTFRENKRNSKIVEWLKANEDFKKDDSSNNKYYILLLGDTAWYYYGPDTHIPGWGIITGSLEAFRNTINLLRDSNRAARDTSATVKETFANATDFLRKKDK